MNEPQAPIPSLQKPSIDAIVSAAERTIFLCVNGILTFPGDENDWNIRFCTWLDKYGSTLFRAHAVQYLCGVIGRAFGQRNRCLKLMKLLGEYQGWKIVLIGHSNGCAVILKALRMAGWPRIEAIHLVSGACECDFDKNGLNEALRIDRVGRVFVYVGGKDKALRLAHTLPGKLLGYGVLGLAGPVNVATNMKAPYPERVTTYNSPPWDAYGHSTWWEENNFDATCELLTKA